MAWRAACLALEVRLGGSWRGVFGLEVRLAGVWLGGAISKCNGQMLKILGWVWVFGLEVCLGGKCFGLESGVFSFRGASGRVLEGRVLGGFWVGLGVWLRRCVLEGGR